MGNLPSVSEYENAESVNLVDMNLTYLPFTPHPESQTKYLHLSGNNIETLPENMKNVTLVDLSSNEMGPSLPVNVAKALTSYGNMQKLELTKNQLEDLSEFENCSIDTINLLQNRFHILPNHFFERFPKLNTVFFDCNFLKTFQNQSSNSIVKLSLSLNCIESIDSSSIYFSQLTYLDLSKNQIKELPNNLSKSFPALQDLNLSDNFITEIPEDQSDDSVFPTTLKVLNLSNNLITKLPSSVTNLPNLANLNIDNNQIETIPELNKSLKKFIATNNKINKVIEQEISSLKEFALNNNELDSFPTELKIPKMNSILINHNNFREINFTNILSSKITTIDISFNQIESIPKEIFTNLPNLHAFYAYFNKITEIPAEISNCKTLFTLDISYNPIKKLPKLPRSLDRIYASNCQIESFDDDPFVGPSTTKVFLSHVDLSGNNLESFSNIESVQILNLSQNRIKKLPLITENLRILDVSMNQIESTPDSIPQIISGVSITDLNLSHNKLTEVPQFHKVPILQNLELTGNPIKGCLDLSLFQFLERVDLSQTAISPIGECETLKEVIVSHNDEIENNDDMPIMKRPVCIYQDTQKSGYSEILGLRNKMEDSIIIRDDLNLYAICDGHGGPNTAKFASIKISDLFDEKIKKGLYQYDTAIKFVSDIFNQTEKELERMNLQDGSTLCLSFVCKNNDGNRKIVTANIGDSRALIVRSDGKSRELTKDHKPTMRSEFERVHNEFGKLNKENRIDGVLAVARSLGDYSVYGVGKKPDLNEFYLDENDKYLVIGCDGVFDVLSNDDVARVAMNASSTTEAAFIIRNAAFASLSSDNISVIVVDLTKYVSN